jgi:chromosome segregation ATPase
MALVDRLQAERRVMCNEIDVLRRALEESRASNAALTDQAADWDQTRSHFVGQQEYLKQTIQDLEALNEELAAEADLVEAKEQEISRLEARTAKLTNECNRFACEAHFQAQLYQRLEARSKTDVEEVRAEVTRTMDDALRKQEQELNAVNKMQSQQIAELEVEVCMKHKELDRANHTIADISEQLDAAKIATTASNMKLEEKIKEFTLGQQRLEGLRILVTGLEIEKKQLLTRVDEHKAIISKLVRDHEDVQLRLASVESAKTSAEETLKQTVAELWQTKLVLHGACQQLNERQTTHKVLLEHCAAHTSQEAHINQLRRALDATEKDRRALLEKVQSGEAENWDVPVAAEAGYKAILPVEERNTWDMVETDESHDDWEAETW